MRLFLGTHEPSWLARLDVPLFVSHRRLYRRRTLPRAVTRWALDSGGFTELAMYGEWRTTPETYVAAVRRYRDQIGYLEWAAPQDWMCEPVMLGRTGLTVAEHQRFTVDSYLTLRHLAPDLPFVPVLQGWDRDDYLRCADAYERAGVDLSSCPLVGLGSVCRRQHTTEIARIVGSLTRLGLRLHGFGVKVRGLALYAEQLASADSLAWSYRARRAAGDGRRNGGCTHRSCASCPRFALAWREKVLHDVEYGQTSLNIWS